MVVRSGLERRGLGLQARGCCVGNNGEVGGHWVGSCLSSWAWRGAEEQEARGYLGDWGVRCRAALPHLARRVCGGLVVGGPSLPPSTPGLDPGCQGLSGSVGVWILRWVGDQVRRGDLV